MLPVNTPLVAPMLPTFALPVAFSVPVMLAPVPVTTTTLAVPTEEILTLPLAAGMFMFELPLANAPINVVAVIELFAKLLLIPALAHSAILPLVALANITYPVPVPGAVTLMLSATLAYATFKLDTRVVLVTVNGAVPSATFDIRREAVNVPAVLMLPPTMLPVTDSAVPPVLAIVTGVAALNVAEPVPNAAPIAIVVVEPAAPFSPILSVFVFPDCITPLAITTVCVLAERPILIKPVCATPPIVVLPVV